MKVILLQDIKGVGRRGEVKSFPDGYVQNFLLPRKLAVIGTTEKIAGLQKEEEHKHAQKEIQKDLLIKEIHSVKDVSLVISKKVNSIGSLFAKVEKQEIKDQLTLIAHAHIPAEYIHLGEIKHTGDFSITIGDKKKLGVEYTLPLKVIGL